MNDIPTLNKLLNEQEAAKKKSLTIELVLSYICNRDNWERNEPPIFYHEDFANRLMSFLEYIVQEHFQPMNDERIPLTMPKECSEHPPNYSKLGEKVAQINGMLTLVHHHLQSLEKRIEKLGARNEND